MSETIKVLVCDDHTLFREGIKAILAQERSIEIVGEAHDGRQAVARAEHLNPDVVLMDVSMPDLSGFEATRRICEANKHVKVLILTMYEEEEVIARCLNAGAAGYVLKDAPRAHLIHAIDVVNKGGQYLSSRALKKVVNQYVQGATPVATGYERLTNREREILQLLAEGMTLKDIAVRLVLSVKTVDVHKTNLMRKLDLHDRSELIKYAIQHKLIRMAAVKAPAENGA